MDLIQEGNIGLTEASYKFDYTSDYRFSSYAGCAIERYIIRGIDNKGRAIRLPVSTMNYVRKYHSIKKNLYEKQNKEINLEEIADMMHIDVKKLKRIISDSESILSLNKLMYDEEVEMQDIIESDDYVEDKIIQKELHDNIVKLIKESNLSDKEMLVLKYRFGLDGCKILTLDKIGDSLGITREGTRFIENNALKKLRKLSASKYLKVYLDNNDELYCDYSVRAEEDTKQKKLKKYK